MSLAAGKPVALRLARLERQRPIVRIERRLVPLVAEIDAGVEPLMSLQAIAHEPVTTGVMHVIIGLEQTMLLDDPGYLRPDIRADDPSANLCVVIRRQFVSNIMN